MNRKKITAAALVIIIIAVAVISAIYIGFDKSVRRMAVDLYFMNNDGTGIVAQQHKIRYKNENELISNTLEALRRGPSASKLGRVMPRDTQITNINLSDEGYLSVNFSEDFLSDDPSRNVLSTYAVVKTLCSTGCVSSVKVLAGGRQIQDRDKNSLEYISASDINLETEEYQSEMREVALYFADSSKEKLVREMRTIKITDQQPIEQYIINELIKGTKEKSMNSILSSDTVLASVDVEDNICYLNFKSNFIAENTGGESHEKLVIYSIVNSLTELQTIGRVQFYIDGKRVENFGSMNIKNYISRDTSIIKEGE